MIIAVDFDGTCVTHCFPEVGEDVAYAVDALKTLVTRGHKLILFTMRSNKVDVLASEPGIHPSADAYLDHAVKWFEDRGIKLWGIQTNPGQKHWTTSPKAYAERYIDDAAVGCPLIYDKAICDRPFVDWVKVMQYFDDEAQVQP